MELTQIAALVVVGIAATTDLRTRRVPNVLTFGAAGAAFAFYGAARGVSGLAISGAGWAAGVGLFLPFFLLRGLGAGDVKLLGAVGAWLGPMGAVWSAFLSVMAGGVLAIIVALQHRYLRQALSNLWNLVQSWMATGPRPVPGMTTDDAPGPRLAYATAIAAGTTAAIWFT
jgi:prepilin peptidase CpaA